MLSILSDTQKAVVDTIVMKMHIKPALEYLKDSGFKMSRRTYYRHKKTVEDMKLKRLYFIAKHFQDQHLEKLDRLELIENLMWDNYHKEKDPTKKVKILSSIVEMQPYLTSFYEAAALVLPPNKENENEKEGYPSIRTVDAEWDSDNAAEPIV